jgi:hypothetical protein
MLNDFRDVTRDVMLRNALLRDVTRDGGIITRDGVFMAYVKLDKAVLSSSLWVERAVRDVFITALIMGMPIELTEPAPQLEVDSLNETGFVVPAGEYGFVAAAGIGIVNQALLGKEEGIEALRVLGSPDLENRSQEFEGRRMVRINGGYIILNFMKYRDKDHTAKERSKRYRDKQKTLRAPRRSGPNATFGVNPEPSQMTDEEAAKLRKKMDSK